jgi:hypothetical protein
MFDDSSEKKKGKVAQARIGGSQQFITAREMGRHLRRLADSPGFGAMRTMLRPVPSYFVFELSNESLWNAHRYHPGLDPEVDMEWFVDPIGRFFFTTEDRPRLFVCPLSGFAVVDATVTNQSYPV